LINISLLRCCVHVFQLFFSSAVVSPVTDHRLV
jgi:hypothetical protein